MKRLKLTLLTFSALLVAGMVNAQNQRTDNWCGSDQHLQEQKNLDPALIQKQAEHFQRVRDYIDNNPSSSTQKAGPYIIPVVFHIITDNGSGFVPKSDVDGVMQTMNEDFQRLNADAANTRAVFLPYAMNMDIEFRLAHIDPNGNCTEGIVRKDSPLSTGATDAVKSLSFWDSKKYFNVWVVNSIDGATPPSIIAGYAQFPWSGINSTYGIVIDHNFVRANERTLTHEMGHCLGLLHVFQGGCGSNCSNSGDFICDTPPVTTSSFGCPTTNNTCANDANGPDPYGVNVVDQIENYMSYNGCQNMFTLEQQASMESVLNSTSISQGLAQLNTAANLAATGTANPYGPVVCAPIADFTFNKEFICEGASVTYTDNSYNATPTSWNWTFAGGSPASSSASNPVITYNTAGVYSSTLVSITSAGNSAPVTKNSIITVSSMNAQYSGQIVDGFENTTVFGNDWRIINSGGQTWANTNAAATTGSRSMRIRNFFTNTAGEVDEAISASYDMSGVTNKTMKFKVAFAKKAAANTDKLLVFYSTNCGESWVLKLPLVGSTLATAPNHTSAFVPSGATEWSEKTVDLSTLSAAQLANVRFKFQFTSGGGNDIYIDDINIGNLSVGIDEFSNIGSFNVFPNPTNSSAQISFNLIKNVDNLSVKVRNAVGQEVTSIINGQSFGMGNYNLKIDEGRKLPAGIYFIEFNADDVVKVQKLIIQ